jgi:hypothetical protein
MKNLFFIFAATVLFQSINAKENSFFVGTKVSNGRFINAVKNDFIDKTFRDKSYYLGNYYVFGGKINNLSISGGIGYNLLRYKNNRDYNIDLIIGPIFSLQNRHLISIPINIDYNINIYKDKLFVIVGAGLEYTITISQKFKFQDFKEFNTTMKYKELNKNYKVHSAVVNTRVGLLFAINNRIDLFSTFDFGIYTTKYMAFKNNPIQQKNYNYILSNSIGLNVKFGKNIKKEKKEKETSLKTTSYKTQQPFLLN